MPSEFKWGVGIVGLVVVLIVVIAAMLFVIVGAGERVVITRLGEVSRTLEPGLHWKTPLIEAAHTFDVRIQKYETSATAYSKDIQTVETKIALNYHFNPTTVATTYSEIGSAETVLSNIIDPAIQESFKAAAAKYTAQGLIDERPVVKDEVRKALVERLVARNIVVDDFSITNFTYSDAFEAAIEAKQVAQQNALGAQNKLEQVKFEAEQKIATAKADAQRTMLEAQALLQNINLIEKIKAEAQLEAAKRWNGALPTHMYGSAPLPLLNVTQ